MACHNLALPITTGIGCIATSSKESRSAALTAGTAWRALRPWYLALPTRRLEFTTHRVTPVTVSPSMPRALQSAALKRVCSRSTHELYHRSYNKQDARINGRLRLAACYVMNALQLGSCFRCIRWNAKRTRNERARFLYKNVQGIQSQFSQAGQDTSAHDDACMDYHAC